MSGQYEIRADYDKTNIVIYQAYSDRIALPALKEQRFVPPFSLHRMTWIKPSFLWLMHRSNWGQKNGQEKILGVSITRKGWEEALSLAVLTEPNLTVYSNYNEWQHKFENAHVHLQWDPERSFRGKPLNHYSIQVGLSRFIIEKYVQEWIVQIKDYTPLVQKILSLKKRGLIQKAKSLLPKERIYPVSNSIGKNLLLPPY